jgi:hypothetical protein
MLPVTRDGYSIRSTVPVATPAPRTSNPSGAGGNACDAGACASPAAEPSTHATSAAAPTDDIRDLGLTIVRLLIRQDAGWRRHEW